MKAILMAAGKGTRMMPLTEITPKPMIKIANKTIISYNLDSLAGIVDEVFIVVNYEKEKIMNYFGNSYKGIKISYIIQKDICGTGNAVLQCEPFLKGNFFIMNADDIFSREDIKRCMKHKYAVLGQKVSDPEKYGVLNIERGLLSGIIEKPKKFVSDMANTGLYKADEKIFSILKNIKKSLRGEYEIVDAITELARNEKVFCVKTRKWIAVGYPWHILEANEFFLSRIKNKRLGKIEKGVVIKGNAVIGKNTFLKSGTYIEGNVVIGEGCKIGPNCYIRGSTSIGDNCHIGHAVEIKNSVIGDDTNIAHLSYVGDSVIGQKSNLGAGTIVANLRHDNSNIKSVVNGVLIDTGRRKYGGVIGHKVHTGINTCVYPGRKIYSKKTTLPGEVVKKDIV